MASTVLKFVNRVGIPALETINATQTTTGLTYLFNRHPYINTAFQGFFVAKISGTPAAPQSAVPIYFATDGVANSSVEVCNATGAGLTTGELTDGVYLFFWDDTTKVLRLMTNIV